MARNHGARQQKKAAKQKAKRQEKRADLLRRTSDDPTVRLRRAGQWPVVECFVGRDLWTDGIGYLVIARREGEGRLVFASFLVDVLCLGVKDAFWHTGTLGEFHDLVRKMESTQTMVPIDKAALAKIVLGAVEFARSCGFRPHPDFRHAALLLDGIDPSTCADEFRFGRDGKPFYMRGPNESMEQARAIAERVVEAGGNYVVRLPGPEDEEGPDPYNDFDRLEADD